MFLNRIDTLLNISKEKERLVFFLNLCTIKTIKHSQLLFHNPHLPLTPSIPYLQEICIYVYIFVFYKPFF